MSLNSQINYVLVNIEMIMNQSMLWKVIFIVSSCCNISNIVIITNYTGYNSRCVIFFFHLMIFFVCCKDFWSDQSHGTYSPVTLHFTLKPRSLAGLDFRLVLASPTKPRLSRSLSDSPEAPTLLCRRQTDVRVRKDRSAIPKTQQSSFRLIWKDLMTAKWWERGDGSERRRENQSIIKMYWRESWRSGVLL